MRGNPSAMASLHHFTAVYPRPCGETIGSKRSLLRSVWVYPRPCGETDWLLSPNLINQGLSPPMRGNRTTDEVMRYFRRVYPRPCGETGTTDAAGHALYSQGLSPPMRGNQIVGFSPPLHDGSIPAHAGKPDIEGPHACYSQLGLSPPMRGNHQRRHDRDAPFGSIPAHAGKPCCPTPC